ncbi:MAG TPA: type I methionyl aminopeptidase, partial [Clostridiaceae bacterium]|nr:type I methionyl aminopeptidase [Clostridiaceae bacterium]
MVIIKSAAEITEMKLANRIVAEVLTDLEKFIKPGMTTAEIDRRAEAIIRGHGAEPSFKGYGHPPFPASVCISINEAVVHGIPSDRVIIKEGDIVSVDCGAYINGWHGDAARTFMIGQVAPEVRELVEVTEQSFWAGFAQALPGNRIGDISSAIQKVAESHGFGIV